MERNNQTRTVNTDDQIIEALIAQKKISYNIEKYLKWHH